MLQTYPLTRILSRSDSISNLKLNLRIHGPCGPNAHAGADLQAFLIFCFKPILLSAHKSILLIYGNNRRLLSVQWNLLDFFIRWRLDPRMVFAWCLNSRMSFRRTRQKKEEKLMKIYPDLFASQPESRDEIPVRG